ncbi:mechanosensitive ion channel family protein [Novosphingobium sp. FSW06-99]|uniref:mechanosensitive ion channel family protein n=1 Tax=Novosphingobium sp. FSW06-99 TaxID=1739113 RepID=UPI0009EB1B52|nr:mechanosensitive ion channel domain-containing protein [Novosphingobium sp. FSW06-99]
MTGTPHPIAVPVHAVKAHFHAVNAQLHDWFDTLDDISIDVGKYHISLATALWMVTVVLFALISARVAGSVARRLLRRIKGLDSAQTSLGDKMITLAVWTFAFFATIDTLGISLTAFTVFSGAFGLAIGFGLQTTAGNLIAGIILLLDRSIKPGDVVAVTSGSTTTMGVVNKIGIRAISVTTLDNREYLIPNQNLMTSQVENWSYSSRRVAVSIPISVAYGSDIDMVEALLLEAAAAVPRVLADPPPSVALVTLGPSAIDWSISCWINDPENGIGGIRSEVLKNTWHLFRERGVEIPFPQQDVHLRDSDGIRRLARALLQQPDEAPDTAER